VDLMRDDRNMDRRERERRQVFTGKSDRAEPKRVPGMMTVEETADYFSSVRGAWRGMSRRGLSPSGGSCALLGAGRADAYVLSWGTSAAGG